MERQQAQGDARTSRATPRVLVVTPRFPYPVVGGDRLRIMSISRELAKRADLTLVSLCATREEMSMCVPDDTFASVHRIYHPRWKGALNAFAALPSRRSLQVAYYQSRMLASAVRELSVSHDVLLAHLVRTAEYVCDLGIPAVVEMTDAISMNYERVRNVGTRVGVLQSAIYSLEAARILRYERAVAQRANLAVLVSEVDRQYLFRDDPLACARSAVYPNGVDSVALPYSFADGGSRICFIGNMATLQNMDAARYFAHDVLPVVRRAIPEATFEVVGRIKPSGQRMLSKYSGVRVVGAVRDIAEAVRGCAVGVCPMRLGAGIQNKILEYMSLGIPAVTSSLGHEGLRAAAGVEILVADSPQATADCVVALLRDRAVAERQAEAARRYVTQHHSWPAILAPLCERVQALGALRASSRGTNLPRVA